MAIPEYKKLNFVKDINVVGQKMTRKGRRNGQLIDNSGVFTHYTIEMEKF